MIKLSFDSEQWSDLIGKLEEGQAELAVELDNIRAQMASLNSQVSECLVVLRQIRDK